MAQGEFEAMARQASLTAKEIQRLWQAAARFDGTVKMGRSQAAVLAAKRVVPIPYSRSQLFDRMRDCQPGLFSNFPVERLGRNQAAGVSRMVEEISSGFPRLKRARVRARGTVRHQPIPRVMDKWLRASSVFGVTDLHYIGTRFDARVDTKHLNDFNLLPRGAEGFQSQDSLVISSEGAVTDSHSDDHSGSNHSFTGAKLWLLWDTLEGLKHGLEDVEHCSVEDRAAFDPGTFLALKTARWILIGPGQTMFIPAHLTHKVITLEKYLGLGSFHAGLPGFVDLLIRWNSLPPIWIPRAGGGERCSVEFITRRAVRKLHDLKTASRSERLRWGVPQLKVRLRRPDIDGMKRDAPPDNANLKAFVQAASQLM